MELNCNIIRWDELVKEMPLSESLVLVLIFFCDAEKSTGK